MKEVRVTDSFLSMSAERKNCQNEERYEDCASEEYLKRVKKICSCIPENLLGEADDKKVFFCRLWSNQLSQSCCVVFVTRTSAQLRLEPVWRRSPQSLWTVSSRVEVFTPPW